jgi:hypothetical protein
VRNFSFEIDNDDDGVPDYFTPYQQGFLYDTAGANAESGRRSVHARNDSLGDARGVYARVDLNQTVPEDLEVSGWSKASGVSGTANNDYSLYVDLWYTDGTPLYGQCAVFPSGTHDWAYASKVIHPLKPLRNAVVYALLRKHTGDAWFDHLALRPYRAPDAVATAAEAPAEFSLAGTYPSPCDRCVVLQVASTAPVALAVRVYDLAGATVASSRMAVGSGTTPVSFDTTPLPDGIYMFSVSGRRAVRHALVAVRHR